MFVAGLIPLLVLGLVVWGIVALVRRGHEGDEKADPGIGTVRRLFIYGFALLGVVLSAWGLSLLVAGLLDAVASGADVIAEEDTGVALGVGPELAELIRRMTREACSPAGGRASGCRRGAAPCTPARSRCSQAHRRRPDEAARTSCPRCGSACRGRAGPVLRPRSPQRKGRSGTARATRRHGPAGRARRRCATLHHGAPCGAPKPHPLFFGPLISELIGTEQHDEPACPSRIATRSRAPEHRSASSADGPRTQQPQVARSDVRRL